MGDRTFSLPKEERLSWKRQIDLLFLKGKSFTAYPLRIIYHFVDLADLVSSHAVLISVPKKKIKSAVKRNYIKRRVRESFRLNKLSLTQTLNEKKTGLLIAYIYLDNKKISYDAINQAVKDSIITIQKKNV